MSDTHDTLVARGFILLFVCCLITMIHTCVVPSALSCYIWVLFECQNATHLSVRMPLIWMTYNTPTPTGRCNNIRTYSACQHKMIRHYTTEKRQRFTIELKTASSKELRLPRYERVYLPSGRYTPFISKETSCWSDHIPITDYNQINNACRWRHTQSTNTVHIKTIVHHLTPIQSHV